MPPARTVLEPEPVLDTQPALPPKPDYLTLVAAGDNLYHDVMIRPPEAGQTFNFDSNYQEIKSLIEPADIAFINQETLLGGKEFGFSGYPRFNTPQELGQALVSAGFDIINHANNHIMDKGEKAVFTTMDYWETFPHVQYLGIYRTQELRNTKQVIIEKNNIKIGFLGYTYGTNGLPLPKDKPYLVSLIDTALMAKEIDALRPLCDYLIVSMHWGNEYEHQYNGTQEKLSKFLAEHMVDLVIGHHPHVIQPQVSLSRPDGSGMLCFYSLGNFISAQRMSPTLLGGLLYLKLKKFESAVSVEQAGVIPVVTHYEKNFTAFRVYPLYNYTEELAARHWGRQLGLEISLNYFTALAKKIFAEEIINNNPFGIN
jgi:poly-gamma-glutamate synthesis protein (capsule biosynthesis protein)